MVPEPEIPVAVRYLGVVKDREALIGTLIALKLSGLLTKIWARLDWWLQLAAVLWTTYCTWNQFPVYHRSSLPLALSLLARIIKSEWLIAAKHSLSACAPAARLHPLTSVALRTCNFQNICCDDIYRVMLSSRNLRWAAPWLHSTFHGHYKFETLRRSSRRSSKQIAKFWPTQDTKIMMMLAGVTSCSTWN